MIYNRRDCCGSRLSGVQVNVDSQKCGIIVRARSVNTVFCGNKVGSSVTVRHRSSKYLTLCEVQVFGTVRKVVKPGSGLIAKVPALSLAFKATTGVSFTGQSIKINQGKYYTDTKQIYSRPADLTVQTRQRGGSDECGVVSLFPRSRTRHSGYNAGVGWWGRYFGAGVNGAIGKRGGSGNTNRWQTVRINARADGYVDFYLNGSRRYRVRDNRYRSGVVRLGYGCRNYEFRNLRIKQKAKPLKCSSSPRRFVPGYSASKASSIWANNPIGVSHGRGKLNSPQGWSARYNRKGQWWQMDAGSIRPIVGVETQRRRGNAQRVTGYKVMVSSDGHKWGYVDNGRIFTGNTANNDRVKANYFRSPVVTRYVRIVVQRWTKHISLRAAIRLGRGRCTGSLLSLGKPAVQSSTGWGGVSSRGVDGYTDGKYGKRKCTHTKNSGDPWWKVDLGDFYRVEKVVLWNRQDCCGDRLSGVRIEVDSNLCGTITGPGSYKFMAYTDIAYIGMAYVAAAYTVMAYITAAYVV